jgi:hypothetical protein
MRWTCPSSTACFGDTLLYGRCAGGVGDEHIGMWD